MVLALCQGAGGLDGGVLGEAQTEDGRAAIYVERRLAHLEAELLIRGLQVAYPIRVGGNLHGLILSQSAGEDRHFKCTARTRNGYGGRVDNQFGNHLIVIIRTGGKACAQAQDNECP